MCQHIRGAAQIFRGIFNVFETVGHIRDGNITRNDEKMSEMTQYILLSFFGKNIEKSLKTEYNSSA